MQLHDLLSVDDEMAELEDYVQTTVTATVHDTLTLTCRQDDHTAHDDKVTWYRDRCALMSLS